MNNYILLPRFKFTSFYKYGNLYIKHSDLLKADSDESKLIEECLSLFKKLPYFEYDDEYIILKINIDSPNKDDINVSINQVQEIIALSNQAKISIQSKIDNRIHLSTYQWAEKLLIQIEQFYNKSLIEKGIDALWQISGFKENWRDETFISDGIISDLIIGVTERSFIKSRDKIQNSFISQVIVYDRTDFFPEGADGYLFDICEILCNHLEVGFQFKNTELYNWLLEKHIPGQPNCCWNSYSNDTSYEKLNKFKEALQSKLPPIKIRWENTIAWYLSQKNNIQKKGLFDLKQFNSELNNRLNDNERKFAVVMLGAFFGYKYFYDALYDVLELPFFKKKQKPEIHELPISSKPEKRYTVSSIPAKNILREKSSYKKGEEQNIDIADKKESPELKIEFDKKNDSQPHIITEVIESSDKAEPIFEIVKKIDSEIDLIYSGLTENKKGEIVGLIKEIPILKNHSKWIIVCYEQCVLEGVKTKEVFIKKLNSKVYKLKPFGKKEIDAVIQLFKKRQLIF